jgi:hypothetical protein
MKLFEALGNAWLGLWTVGECVHRVRLDYNLLADPEKEIQELYDDIEENLPKDWEFMSVYEAADLVGYDLTAYLKYMDKQIEKDEREALLKYSMEKLNKAYEKLGVL